MSPVTQYVFDGRRWRNEVRVSRTSSATTPTTRMVIGTDKPNATNTGIPAGTVLKRHDGSITVTTPGTVLENLDIYGKVSVSTTDVVIRRCRVRGNASWTKGGDSGQGLIQCTNSAVRRLVVEDCHLKPTVPHNTVNGMLGHDFTVRRTNFEDCSDAIGTFNTANPSGAVNVVIEGCWMHSFYYIRPSDTGTRAEGTHNDCIQISGGSNYRIVGNRMDGFYNPNLGSAPLDGSPTGPYQVTGNRYFPSMTSTSALMITPNVGPVADVVIDANWLDGGGTSLNVSEKGRGAIRGLAVTNNRFGRNQRNPSVQGYIEAPTYDAMTRSGNILEGLVGSAVLKRVVV
ncbi:MAG TPA: hypothetical protein VEQ66_06395 [Propionibacteriaceae bacterium]|nr:hypothetical protein [Propionibacteriaceae bacterium]